MIITYSVTDGNDQLRGYEPRDMHIVVRGGMMGYRITYLDAPKKRRNVNVIPLTLLFLALFLGWTVRSWEEGSALILETVFPVTAAEAKDAAREMSQQIEEGESVVHAFTDFCQTVFPGETEDPY